MSQKPKYPECGCARVCLACMRSGGRELAARSASLRLTGRKFSPERMTLILDYMAQFPGVMRAVAFSGMSYFNFRYHMQRSISGQPGDGYDLAYDGATQRFHEHFEAVRDGSVQRVEDAYLQRAMDGYFETLHDKGRVIYQVDPDLVNLGLSGPDAYLTDENGRPIPERIEHQDPEVMRDVLEKLRRDRWGRRDKLDVNVRGGVIVVGVRAKAGELEKREQRALTEPEPLDVEFREVEDE